MTDTYRSTLRVARRLVVVTSTLMTILGPATGRTEAAVGCDRVYFLSNAGRPVTTLEVMRGDGSGRSGLGRFPDSEPFSVSPDGSAVAYTRYVEETADSDIWVMRSDGTSRRRITSSSEDDHYPVWSPAGRLIAFERYAPSGPHTYVVDVRTNEERKIAEGTSPSFAPDGKSMTFAAQSPDILDLTHDIFTVSLEDGSITRLTDDPTSDDWTPQWSPTGNWIAFNRYPHGQHNDYHGPYSDLWRIRPDGTDEQEITDVQDDYNGVSDASWSPDGRWIAYNTETDDYGAVHVMRASGRIDRAVTTSLEHWSRSATWSPDGGSVAFERYGSNSTDIWRFDLATGTKKDLTKTHKRSEGPPVWAGC